MFTSSIQDSTQTNYPFLAIVFEGGKSFAQFPCATRLDAEMSIRATIVRTLGSSPREVGARMLIKPDGATDGTVGCGCGEAEVWLTALEVMAESVDEGWWQDFRNRLETLFDQEEIVIRAQEITQL